LGDSGKHPYYKSGRFPRFLKENRSLWFLRAKTISSYKENNKAIVSISDNAGGISADIMDKIFDPYFTPKGPDKSTGVGLFMAKTIIPKNMNGRLIVRNNGAGVEFRIEVLYEAR
jgi:C4-dicarboxylate-specific signal transduction histidine kinase